MIRKRRKFFRSKSAGLVAAARTTPGVVRENNEDSFGIFNVESESPLFVVADGMGGHDLGEEASRTAIDAIREVYFEDPTDDVATALTRAFREANRQILTRSDAHGSDVHMGTTGTALAIRDGRLYAGHIGDSRMYVITEEEMVQITEDHTLVNQLVRDGILSPEEAETDPRRHSLLKGLGIEGVISIDVVELEGIRAGDRILLCSDGLNVVPESRIAEICRSDDVESACEQLVQVADDLGGPDNTTVILIEYR